ncbi:MAG: hypothetical protein ACXVXO_09725 [Mycobacteriaceae bacterium]
MGEAKVVDEIVSDPEAYVEETRRRSKTRAKKTRTVILKTVGVSKPSSPSETRAHA